MSSGRFCSKKPISPLGPSFVPSPRDTLGHILMEYLPQYMSMAQASVKLYHAAFNAEEDGWKCMDLRGTLALSRPSTSSNVPSEKEPWWFCVYENTPQRKLLWYYEIAERLQYRQDKPFFHTFRGKSRQYGFMFDNDHEAAKMSHALQTMSATKAPASPKRTGSLRRLKVTPSEVSLPRSIGRRGSIASSQALVSSTPADISEMPIIKHLSASLRTRGVRGKVLIQHLDFTEGFLQGYVSGCREEEAHRIRV